MGPSEPRPKSSAGESPLLSAPTAANSPLLLPVPGGPETRGGGDGHPHPRRQPPHDPGQQEDGGGPGPRLTPGDPKLGAGWGRWRPRAECDYSRVTRSGNRVPPPTPTPLLQEGAVSHGARSQAGIFLPAQEGSRGTITISPFLHRQRASQQHHGVVRQQGTRLPQRSLPARGQQTPGHIAPGSPTPGGTTPGQAPPQILLRPPDGRLGGTPGPASCCGLCICFCRVSHSPVDAAPRKRVTSPDPQAWPPGSACAWQVPSLQGPLQHCCC